MQVVIGLGFTRAATQADVYAALNTALHTARCRWSDVAEIATLEDHRDHPALSPADTRSSVPVRFFSAAELARVRIPHPSPAVERATGTPSVAEAAALAASGAAGLLVPKRCTPRVCTAVARLRDAP